MLAEIVTLFIVPLICNLMNLDSDLKDMPYRDNTPDLHLVYISKNESLIELSNNQFFNTGFEHETIQKWGMTDHLSLRFTRDKKKFERLVLSNLTKNEAIWVELLCINPALHTLDQPCYPYLHLKYVDKNGHRLLLSNDEYLEILPKYTQILFSWDCSDVLFYKKVGFIQKGSLYNQTKHQTIPVQNPPGSLF